MPTPQQLVVAAEVAGEVLPQLARGGETALNFLNIADRAAPAGARLAAGLGKAETVAGLVDTTMAPLMRTASKVEAASVHAMSGLGAEGVVANFGDNAWVMQSRYARVTEPSLVLRGSYPSIQPLTFDTADNVGRIWTQAKQPLAAVAYVPTRVTEPIGFGSGFAVRNDGLVVAARHVVRGGPPGDIWVRFPYQPGASFKAGIFAESAADDIVLLKPLTPIGTPVRHVPLTAFTDAVAPRSQLVSVGIQNHNFITPGALSGDLHLSQGQLIEKVPIRFPGESPTERLRTTILGEYGMSGGPTYELRSGNIAGAMLGGNDYSWSGVAKGGSIKNLIARNFHRP